MKNKEENSQIYSVGQEQVQDLLFSREISWKEIIYDLISTEQLNPWDINLTILTDKYLQKIQELEESDFFISSKVLLAASLLLRIKSEFLLNKYIRSIDEILFGKKENKKYEIERIELNEEIPDLIPKSPIPRYKRITLNELMESLNKAIKTENRRIKKVIINNNSLKQAGFSLPKKKISIKDKLKIIYKKIIVHFEKNNNILKISFSEFAGEEKEEKINHFYPLLELDNRKKVWLEQEKPFEEFHIWLRKIYFEKNGDPYSDLKEEVKEQIKEIMEEDVD
jgi:segregation and condensation protein A